MTPNVITATSINRSRMFALRGENCPHHSATSVTGQPPISGAAHWQWPRWATGPVPPAQKRHSPQLPFATLGPLKE